MGFYGNITVQLRLSVLGIQTFLDEGKGRKTRGTETDLKVQLRTLHSKFNSLMKKVNQLEAMFAGKEPERDYASLVKPPPVPPRLVRIGSPVVSDDSEGSYELPLMSPLDRIRNTLIFTI